MIRNSDPLSLARGALLRLSLLLGSLGIALVVGEVAARVVLHPGDYLRASLVQDSILGHVIEPHSSGHDAWGFRNREVPSSARVVTIGDSQTYGHTAPLTGSWPYQLQGLMGEPVYNLGLGGYGPLEYLHVLRAKAPLLNPEVIIVGLYLGNDLEDAYKAAYNRPYWREWIISEAGDSLAGAGAETVRPQKPAFFLGGLRHTLARQSVLYGLFKLHLAGPIRSIRGRRWAASVPRKYQFFWVDPANVDVKTVFAPHRRLAKLDQTDPTNAEGLLITKQALEASNKFARSNHAQLLVAMIPTKEEVYCDYLRAVGDSLPRSFEDHCDQERSVKGELATFFERNEIRYVDTSKRLKEAVTRHMSIYPSDWDGHPSADGYKAIAEAVYAALGNPREKSALLR